MNKEQHVIHLDKRPRGPVAVAQSPDRRDSQGNGKAKRRPTDGIGRRAPLGLPCHRHNPDLWFAESPADLEFAKALCRDCPVRQACLAGALRRKEPYGVWGAEIVVAGRVVARKRPRGRPRKDAA
jgi:WhiB family redox-sensing transcriptional regulator